MNLTSKILGLIILGFVLLGLSTVSGSLFGQDSTTTIEFLVIPAVPVFVYALILVMKKAS